MTAPEPTPTAEHIDAVARVLYLALPDPDVHRWDHLDTLTRAHYRTLAAALLTTPAVHAAMLAALVDRGNDEEIRRRLEWATGRNGLRLLAQIRDEGLDVIRVTPEQVAP